MPDKLTGPSVLEARIRDLLNDKEIMEYSEAESERTRGFLKDGVWQRGAPDNEYAPCVHDDDFLCDHRIKALARKIARAVEGRNG